MLGGDHGQEDDGHDGRGGCDDPAGAGQAYCHGLIIGTGLLAQRLRELEDAGIIEKAVLPPPAASTVYQLTPDGESLRSPLLGLTRFGLRRLGTPTEGQTANVNLLAFAMAARFNPSNSPAADGTYQLCIDGSTFKLAIDNGTVNIQAGPTHQPQAVISTDMATLIAINNGTTTLAEALTSQVLTVDGDPTAIVALANAFELDPQVT